MLFNAGFRFSFAFKLSKLVPTLVAADGSLDICATSTSSFTTMDPSIFIFLLTCPDISLLVVDALEVVDDELTSIIVLPSDTAVSGNSGNNGVVLAVGDSKLFDFFSFAFNDSISAVSDFVVVLRLSIVVDGLDASMVVFEMLEAFRFLLLLLLFGASITLTVVCAMVFFLDAASLAIGIVANMEIIRLGITIYASAINSSYLDLD